MKDDKCDARNQKWICLVCLRLSRALVITTHGCSQPPDGMQPCSKLVCLLYHTWFLLLLLLLCNRKTGLTHYPTANTLSNGQNGPKWSKIVPNGPKWWKNGQNGQKWSKNGQNRQQWSKMVQTGSKWYQMVQMVKNGKKKHGQSGLKWSKMFENGKTKWGAWP